MSKIEKLTKKQIALQKEVSDEWIDITLSNKDFDKEEVEEGVKWIYYASNLKEPEVVLVDGPNDFVKKLEPSVWDSVRNSVRDSVWNSVRDSVRNSVRDSVWNSVRDSVWDSVWDSVRDSVWDSVRDSVWNSVRDSVRNSVRNSVRDSVWDSVSSCSLAYDSDFGAWYEYWKKIKVIEPQEKADKYIGFLRSGAFYCMFFEKAAFVMRRPTIVSQNDRKQLHSVKGPALAFKDGTEIYKLNGVTFTKEWWSKIVNDELGPETIFAIDNLEHRRIAYEFMDKSKMKNLKDFTILDEKTDEKGNPMKIISFKVKGVDEPLKYYNCFCPSTGREYYLGTAKDTCKEAKAASFGLEDAEFVNEW